MKNLIELIQDAYCWEGGARAKVIPSTNPAVITFSVCGSSTVEHSGDVDGIRQQVGELRGQSVVDNEVTYTILSATIKTVDGERREDSDYSVGVSGNVTVAVKNN